MIFRLCLLKFHLNCLVVWTNKTSSTEVKLILVSCISNHFTVRILAFGVSGRYSFCVKDGRAVTATLTNMFIWWINSILRVTHLTNLATVWFQQDGATALTVQKSMDTLKDSIVTLYHFPLWQHFLARPFALSVSLCYLLDGTSFKVKYSKYVWQSYIISQNCWRNQFHITGHVTSQFGTVLSTMCINVSIMMDHTWQVLFLRSSVILMF